MNKKRLNDAIESCIQTLNQEGNIDSALADYPNLDKTLRPLLEVSLRARDWENYPVPEEAISRGREKLFQRLEELQKERICWRMTMSLPSLVHTVKHTWNSVRLPLFINRHTRRSLNSIPHKNKASEEDDHMPTPQP